MISRVLRLAGLPLTTVLTLAFVALAAALLVARSPVYVAREVWRHQWTLRARQAVSAARLASRESMNVTETAWRDWLPVTIGFLAILYAIIALA